MGLIKFSQLKSSMLHEFAGDSIIDSLDIHSEELNKIILTKYAEKKDAKLVATFTNFDPEIGIPYDEYDYNLSFPVDHSSDAVNAIGNWFVYYGYTVGIKKIGEGVCRITIRLENK